MKCFNDYIVDTQVLKDNIGKIKIHVGRQTKICAVVKANAYGVGMHTVCKALKGRVDFFACACVKEALNIRVYDKETPVLILGAVDISSIDCIVENNISISVGSIDFLNDLVKIRKMIKIHLQINTGLNRFGFKKIRDFKRALKLCLNSDNLVLEGVYSHFATKKNDTVFMGKQYLRFLQFKRYVKDSSVIFHISNSFATECFSSYHFDMVRVGMVLYGFLPNKLETKPIATIKSKIVHVVNLKKGDSVGYDRTFVASKNMIIGVVPVGYADGMNRLLSNKAKVLVNGAWCKVLGMICMDVFMVDLSNIDAQVGSSVVILGDDKGKTINVNDYAKIIKTSPYEIICSFKYNRMNYIVKD